MKINTLYALITENSLGGQRMDSYLKEDSAISKSKEIIEHIQKNKGKGFKLYLSELEYDEYNNRILSDNLINNKSQLLFQN